MKVVIQCAGRKVEDAGNFLDDRGRTVKFVAHPELCGDEGPGKVFARPDEPLKFAPGTWRDYLVAYNKQSTNPRGLKQAGRLYRNPAYGRLLDAFGAPNVFILSAGWGLVRSDYPLPDYNITFSKQGTAPCNRRRREDLFLDYNHLATAEFKADDKVYFLGGKDYLPLFLSLAAPLQVRKIVFYQQSGVSRSVGFTFVRYPHGRTNWHYQCATDLADGLYADL